MSTFEEVSSMFPEAKLVNPETNVALRTKEINEYLCVDKSAVPVASYKKESGKDVHNLDVYADGSYNVYGTIGGTSVVNSDGYEYFYDNLAYGNLGTGITMRFYYDYKVSTTALTPRFTAVSNGSTTDTNLLLVAVFYNAVLSSGTYAYRRADLTELETNIVSTYYLKATVSGREINVYLD
jgi:hypothetical protein